MINQLPERDAIRKSFAVTTRTLVVTLLVFAGTFAAAPAHTIHGTWIATVGKGQTLHGTWAGGALPHRPNVVEGTWSLISAGQVVLQGTWRAEKSSRGWEGQWSGQTAGGRSLGGFWGADLEHWTGKTFQEMLEKTLREQVSGWWQAGHVEGNWWLKGSRSHSH